MERQEKKFFLDVILSALSDINKTSAKCKIEYEISGAK